MVWLQYFLKLCLVCCYPLISSHYMLDVLSTITITHSTKYFQKRLLLHNKSTMIINNYMCIGIRFQSIKPILLLFLLHYGLVVLLVPIVNISTGLQYRSVYIIWSQITAGNIHSVKLPSKTATQTECSLHRKHWSLNTIKIYTLLTWLQATP